MNLTETPRAPSSGSTARHVRRPRRRSSGRTGMLAWALVGVFAVMSGLLSPRGPITSAAAVGALVGALGVGVALGLLTRSRWWMLIAPALFVLVFEFVRIGAEGPTVDMIRLSSTYGVIAFIVGRVAHGVVVLGRWLWVLQSVGG